MNIDVFKSGVFESLTTYNQEVLDVASRWKYIVEGQDYDFPNRKVSSWFDPKHLRSIYIPKSYPKHVPLTDDPKFCLKLYCCNYASVFVINELYKDRKDVLIEDVGSGIGRFAHYLNKLGFTNFSFQDNFSQVDQKMFKDMMETSGITNYQLNNLESDPIIMNQVALPALIKAPSPSIELSCFYNNTPRITVDDTFEEHNLKFLCRDVDDLMHIYCKPEKMEEFTEKLKPFQVT